MQDSSVSSGTAFILKAKHSAALRVWWYALHAVLALSAIALNLNPAISAALLGAVIVHGCLRAPKSGTLLLRSPTNRWSLPALQRFDLALAPETTFSGVWVRLVFSGDDAPAPIVLLKDQLTNEEWRRLQVAVRER